MATEHIVFLSEDLGFYCADCMQKRLDDGGEYFHEIDLNYATKGDRLTCQDCEKTVTGNLPADSGYDHDDGEPLDDLIAVRMGKDDWENVIIALRSMLDKDCWFIADSIQDVLG
jgi:hypothetical protein